MALLVHSTVRLTPAQSHLLLERLLPLSSPDRLPLQLHRAAQESLPPVSAPAPMVKLSRATLSAALRTPTSDLMQTLRPPTPISSACLLVTPQLLLDVKHGHMLEVQMVLVAVPVI